MVDPGIEYSPDYNKYATQYHSLQIIRADESVFVNGNAPNLNHVTFNFNGKNTWGDFGLIPTSRPVIAPPGVKANFIDMQGWHGSIDVTEMLTGYPTYAERSGSIEFLVVGSSGKNENWIHAYEEIMDYCHGYKVKIILFDDMEHYYLGRMSVNQWQSEKDWSKITLDYRVEPFKYSCATDTIDDLLAQSTPIAPGSSHLGPEIYLQAEGEYF